MIKLLYDLLYEMYEMICLDAGYIHSASWIKETCARKSNIRVPFLTILSFLVFQLLQLPWTQGFNIGTHGVYF